MLRDVFLKIILLARTTTTTTKKPWNSRKFIASPNKKAQKYTSFGHDLVQRIMISSEQWFFVSVIFLSCGFTLPCSCQDGCQQLPELTYFIRIQMGRVAHLTTIETEPSILTGPSKEQPRSNHHHRGWDNPDWLGLRMVTVSTIQTEWLA